MNRLMYVLLRMIGLARPGPKTRFQRAMRRFERVFLGVALAYGGLQVFPQVLFAYSVSDGGMTLYARHPLSARAAERLAQARVLVDRSELAVPDRRERIFLCDSPWLFRVFAPSSPRAFAISTPLTDNIFIAGADVAADLATSQASDHPTRSFTGVIAHEATHGLIRRRLGFWRMLRLPTWVEEGYCDYIAREGSFPDAEGRRLFVDGRKLTSASFRYYKYRQMVAYLVDGRHLSFGEVAGQAREADSVEREAREALRSRGIR